MNPDDDRYMKLMNFIEDNQTSIYRVAFSYVKEQQTALDIVQESIVKALSSYRAIKDVNALNNWFYRIVVNTSISHIKKNKRIVLTDDVTQARTEIDVPHEDRISLYDAIDQLRPRDKTVIILRFFEDRKLEDIAAITNAKLSTVKSRLYSALDKLNKIMTH